MSKRRLVITAVLSGQSQSEVARTYGVSQGWISKLMARYRLDGEAAFEPLLPRSRHQPRRDTTVDRRAGPAAAQGAARGRPGRRRRHDRLAPDPPPRHHRVPRDDPPDPGPDRSDHPRPEEATQEQLPAVRSRPAQRDLAVRLHPLPPGPPPPADSRQSRCRRGDPDLARRLLPLRPVGHRPPHRSPAAIVLATFRRTAASYGFPASTLTDNGMVFTTRFAGGKGGRNPSNTSCTSSASPRRTASPTTRRPKARSNGSSRPSRSGSRPTASSPPPSPSCRTCSTVHRRSTTTTGRTGPCRTAPHPRPSTRRCPRPRPRRPPYRHPRPRPPRQDRQGRQRHAARRRAAYATSASAEPTPEPTSCCSSKTSTSPSWTPPPARSCAT